jgi:O-antigen/teichoic acid export membrane protein
MGQDAVGVYGIGARVAGISALIYMAFSGGWQYFAFSTMKDSDHVLLISRTFQVLALLSFTATLFFIPAIRLAFPFLVGHTYMEGSIITPYLFLSPLLLMLSQILGTQLQVIKRPGLSTTIRSACAFLNVVLNFLLIPIMGIEGAAIATVSSYAVMTFLMAILTFKFDLFVLDRRFLAVTLSFTLLFGLYKKLMWNSLLMAVVLASMWTFAVLWSYRRVAFATLSRLQKKVREHYAWSE